VRDAVTLRIVQKAAALVALAGLVAPGVLAVAAAAHLATHHDHDGKRDHRRVASSLIWHGHAHEDAVPDHDHPLEMAGMPPFQTVRSRVVPLQACAYVIGQVVAVSFAGKAEGSPSRQPDPLGLGPPVLARVSVLRI